MEEELRAFMMEYGKILVDAIKYNLNQPFAYAPGFDNDAYNQSVADGGRNPKFKGSAAKSPFGSALSDSIELQWDNNASTLNVLMLDYWKYVNFGRKKGKYAPIAPIEEWLAKKGIQGRDKKGRFVTRRSTAFGVSTNIFKFGIAPTNFYGNAVDSVVDKLVENFENNADDMIDRFLDNIFEKSLTPDNR